MVRAHTFELRTSDGLGDGACAARTDKPTTLDLEAYGGGEGLFTKRAYDESTGTVIAEGSESDPRAGSADENVRASDERSRVGFGQRAERTSGHIGPCALTFELT